MATLKDHAKKANLKGFRPGKVPISIVKKMFGKGVVFEEVNKVISEQLHSYIQEEKLALLGDPMPRKVDDMDLNPDADAEYQFEYEIGMAPEFEVNFDLKTSPTLYAIDVDDAYLEKELEATQEAYGEMTNPEISGEGDILFGKLIMDKEVGDELPEGWDLGEEPTRMFPMNPARVHSDKMKANMIGKKPEDLISGIKMSDLAKNDDGIRAIWEFDMRGQRNANLTEEQFEALKNMTFAFEVMKVNHVEKAELDQDLFDKVFRGQNIESLDDFKAKIKARVEKSLEEDAKNNLKNKTIEGLLELNDVPLPDEFLKKWLVESNEKLTEDQIELQYPDYQKQLRWSLIVNHVRKANEDTIVVDEEKLKAKAKETARTQYAQVMPNAKDSDLEGMAGYMLSDKKTRDQIESQLIEELTFNVINEKITPVHESISATDYLELS